MTTAKTRPAKTAPAVNLAVHRGGPAVVRLEAGPTTVASTVDDATAATEFAEPAGMIDDEKTIARRHPGWPPVLVTPNRDDQAAAEGSGQLDPAGRRGLGSPPLVARSSTRGWAMSETFDPYYKWLGIRPEEQPPDHYRLLGIGKFENDLDVIANAADQRMAHLQTFQNSKHAAESQRLLNEVALARVCLLNPEKRTAHDQRLRQKLQSSSVTGRLIAPKPGLPPVVVTPVPVQQDLPSGQQGAHGDLYRSVEVPFTALPKPPSVPQTLSGHSTPPPPPPVSNGHVYRSEVDSFDLAKLVHAPKSRRKSQPKPNALMGAAVLIAVVVGCAALWWAMERGGTLDGRPATNDVEPSASATPGESSQDRQEDARQVQRLKQQEARRREVARADQERQRETAEAAQRTAISSPASQPPIKPVPEAEATAPLTEIGSGEKFFDASKEPAVGKNVSVAVTLAKLGRFIQVSRSKRIEGMKVTLQITNNIENRRLKCQWLALSQAPPDSMLVDSFDQPNAYALKKIVPKSEDAIDPKHSLDVDLIFEKPIKTAKYVHLKLPGTIFNEPDPVRIEIPKDMIKPADEEEKESVLAEETQRVAAGGADDWQAQPLGGRWIDLLAAVDPIRNRVDGEWRRDGRRAGAGQGMGPDDAPGVRTGRL